MWTKSLQKKAKSTLPVVERRYQESGYVGKKKTGEMAEGMGKDKRDRRIYIMENISESTPLNS